MNKKFLFAAVLTLGLGSLTTACNNEEPTQEDVAAADIDYNEQNATSWHNYMRNVALLLQADATNLYNAWSLSYKGGEPFANIFKQHKGTYKSAWNNIEEIIDGCVEIASEVGETKIGDPYKKFIAGNPKEAVYAVESWYSWHSRDDYTNNIRSIRNAYYGSLDGTADSQSLATLIAKHNAALDANVKNAIAKAEKAIQTIPQPFRNNINSKETVAAITACKELEDVFNLELKPYIGEQKNGINNDAILDPIVTHYVDAVVLPTYKNLKEKNEKLLQSIEALAISPSNSAFEKACTAWIDAREPWESSEAFLFGPVDELGLDPNMDSWPLDQNAIVQILNGNTWNTLKWEQGDDEKKVETAQNVRGFHTLEFLLFKDGQPRRVK